ncbi:hypothetical protein [Thermococcus sp.]|uniref:hypothetical protein n=1 Tax=Thermococcus sp. TaxID=35749 RepID=UPI0025F88A6F|nr:hypothetical protein [Thermococcus sp.]
MRRLLPFFLILLILLASTAPGTIAVPGNPVIRPGAYFVYVARTNESVNVSSLVNALGSGNLFFSLKRNGEPVFVSVYGNGSVEFEVLSVENGTATVRLMVSGTDALVRYVGNITPFWSEGEVTSSETHGNVTRVAVSAFRLSSVYRLNVLTGTVYDLEGRSYGRTLLFYGRDVRPGRALFTAPDGLKVSVSKVSTLNATVVTYYGKFLPPLIQVVTTPYEVSMANITASGRSILIYDPGSGVLLSYFGFSWADFRAAGFSLFGGIDRGGFSVPGKDEMFAPGLVLADTNVLGGGMTVKYSPETSPLVYVYFALLSFAGFFVLLEVRRWGGS